jgi:hypothetical protein
MEKSSRIRGRIIEDGRLMARHKKDMRVPEEAQEDPKNHGKRNLKPQILLQYAPLKKW